MSSTIDNIKSQVIQYANQCVKGFNDSINDKTSISNLNNKFTKTLVKTGLVALAVFAATALLGFSAPAVILFTAVAGIGLFVHRCHYQGESFSLLGHGIKLGRGKANELVNPNWLTKIINWLHS